MSAEPLLWCRRDVGSLIVDVYLAPMKGKPLNGLLGLWDADTHAIHVAWELPREAAEAVLLHELGHAGIFASGAKIGDSDADEESALSVVVGALYGALKRNAMVRFPVRPVTPHDRARVRKARVNR